jgi:hypothetical protein
MAYIGLEPSNSFVSLKRQVITGDGTASYTLDHSVASVNDVAIFVNNVRQDPAGYSISGAALTLGGTIQSSDDCYVIFLGQALQTVTPDSDTITTAMLKSNAVTSAKLTYPLTTFSSTGIDDNADATAMTITSAEKVGIGETVPLGQLHVKSGDSGVSSPDITDLVVECSGSGGISLLGATDGQVEIAFGDSGDANIGRFAYNHNSNYLATVVNGTERMNLGSSGALKIAKDGAAFNSNTAHQFVDSGANTYSLMISNKASSPASQYMIEVGFKSAAPDNNSARFMQFIDNSATRAEIMSDGDFRSHDNSYGSTSDQRIKQDIVDSGSQWDDIKAVKVRKFKKKDDVRQYGDEAWVQIGVIAQELEAAGMDKLIKHSDPNSSDILSDSTFGTLYEDGDEIPEGKAIGDIKEIKAQIKGVGYSVLYMKAIKALQEAMTRIETLESKVKTLEDA